MINRLKNLWKWRYRQGVISYQNGNVSMCNIKFDGVTVVVRNGYVELREAATYGAAIAWEDD